MYVRSYTNFLNGTRVTCFSNRIAISFNYDKKKLLFNVLMFILPLSNRFVYRKAGSFIFDTDNEYGLLPMFQYYCHQLLMYV